MTTATHAPVQKSYRAMVLTYLTGATLVLAGAAGPLPGCASLGAEDVPGILSVAETVLRVAKDESERVRTARERCKALEHEAGKATDAERAADILRALAAAQTELADALSEEHPDAGTADH